MLYACPYYQAVDCRMWGDSELRLKAGLIFTFIVPLFCKSDTEPADLGPAGKPSRQKCVVGHEAPESLYEQAFVACSLHVSR
jgi:hypothetical protein